MHLNSHQKLLIDRMIDLMTLAKKEQFLTLTLFRLPRMLTIITANNSYLQPTELKCVINAS